MTISEHAHAIIDVSSDPSAVFGHFAQFVRPGGWSGSLAEIIARRLRAFETLLQHERSDVRSAAAGLITQIKGWEDRERQRERAENQDRDQ